MLVRGGVSGGSATDRVILRAIGSAGRALCLLGVVLTGALCLLGVRKGRSVYWEPWEFWYSRQLSARTRRPPALPSVRVMGTVGNGLPITSRYFKGISRS
jgi:hypothetical protein